MVYIVVTFIGHFVFLLKVVDLTKGGFSVREVGRPNISERLDAE